MEYVFAMDLVERRKPAQHPQQKPTLQSQREGEKSQFREKEYWRGKAKQRYNVSRSDAIDSLGTKPLDDLVHVVTDLFKCAKLEKIGSLFGCKAAIVVYALCQMLFSSSS